MNIGDRIKELRKSVLEMTQDEFSEKIGIKRSGLSLVEIGRNNPSDQTIRSICREFGVSESWLRYGEGEMKIQLTRDKEIAEMIAKAQMEPAGSVKNRVFSMMAKLDEEDWEAITRFAELLTNKDA